MKSFILLLIFLNTAQAGLDYQEIWKLKNNALISLESYKSEDDQFTTLHLIISRNLNRYPNKSQREELLFTILLIEEIKEKLNADAELQPLWDLGSFYRLWVSQEIADIGLYILACSV